MRRWNEKTRPTAQQRTGSSREGSVVRSRSSAGEVERAANTVIRVGQDDLPPESSLEVEDEGPLEIGGARFVGAPGERDDGEDGQLGAVTGLELLGLGVVQLDHVVVEEDEGIGEEEGELVVFQRLQPIEAVALGTKEHEPMAVGEPEDIGRATCRTM